MGGGGAESRGGASEAWLSGRWLVWGRIVGDGSNAYQRKEGATGEKMPSTFFHLSEWRMSLSMTLNKMDPTGGDSDRPKEDLTNRKEWVGAMDNS